MEPVTFGVEEEFLLLHPVHGQPAPAAPRILRTLRGLPGLRAELMRYQLETASPVCRTAGDLYTQLIHLRQVSAAAARTCGCLLVASGTSPYGTPGLSALTDDPRYRELARLHPACVARFGACGCHIHVGVSSRELGVHVLGRLRPWLGTLLALSANSPLENAHDTGWASRRYPALALWPTARPPSVWTGTAAYDRFTHGLIACGAALDERAVYLLARLSPQYPTIELRVADVCPDAETTLLLAVLTRALVTTAIRASRHGRPVPRPARETIRASLNAAARHGLTGPAIDPSTGRTTDPWTMVHRLVEHTSEALTALGDGDLTDRLLQTVAARGGGAERQRAAWQRAESPAALVAELAETTAAAPRTAVPVLACRP